MEHWLTQSYAILLKVVEQKLVYLRGLWLDVTAIHEKCFMTFMVTSELYMVLTCVLLTRYRAQPPSNVESKSLRLKYQLLGINVVSFVLAGYFFIRHNLYCEPGGEEIASIPLYFLNVLKPKLLNKLVTFYHLWL